MVRPAMLTVTVLNRINIWNELLFALLFILDANMRTLQAGVARFYGFQSTDYALVFAAVAISTLTVSIAGGALVWPHARRPERSMHHPAAPPPPYRAARI